MSVSAITAPDLSAGDAPAAGRDPSIRISPRHPRYFETADGRPFIPIGLNLCFPRFAPSAGEGLACYARWLDALSAHGGNFARLWLGHSFFDIEPLRAGRFAEEPARRLDAVLGMARERGVRVKITLEHFRTIAPRAEAEIFPGAASFSRSVYAKASGGFADDMAGFLDRPECRRRYLEKLDWLAARYASHPAIFGWELWNEMNAVEAPRQSWLDWTRVMLPELRRRFPGHLVMQSLGSFDSDEQTSNYADYARLPGGDLVQVHRYLDPGAALPCCQGPMDRLCADAVNTLLGMAPGKPVLLAECGAVEARHAAPSRLYETDTEGILLHDQLFAPFFAGAAGPGQAWHWDFYVERHGLWHHFRRFAEAVGDFDPIDEAARPAFWQTPRLRVHALLGRRVSLLWLRDRACDWSGEFVEGRPALPVAGEELACDAGTDAPRLASYFDPWSGASGRCGSAGGGRVLLPAFRRSLVLRLETKGGAK